MIKEKLCFLACLVVLTVACGGGGGGGDDKSNTVAPEATSTLSGSIDAITGLGKAGNGELEDGEVLVRHLSNNNAAAVDVLVDNQQFKAMVKPGHLLIEYLSDSGLRLRKVVTGIAEGEQSAGVVDLDSTIIAELVEKVKLSSNNEVNSLGELPNLAQAIADMQQLLADSTQILKSTGAGFENKWGAALVAQSIKNKVTNDVKNKTDITSSDYKVSDSDILDLLDDVAMELQKSLDDTGKLYFPGGLVINKSSDPNVLSLNRLEVGSLILQANDFQAAPVPQNKIAVLTNVDSSFTASALSTINVQTLESSPIIKAFDTSDVTVESFNSHFYVIGRYNADFVEKFHIANPSIALYHYSTVNSDEATQNPQSLIFKNETKAYLSRYGSAKQWIVNPSAKSESGFKLGEIDLSHYLTASDDGALEASNGVIVDGKLFLALQRMEFFATTATPYVVVIDTESNEEIDTGMAESGSGLKGIALPTQNPDQIFYNEDLKLIFVQCVGQYFPQLTKGGILTINPVTYEVKFLLDDGPDDSSTGTFGGLINHLAVVDTDTAFISIYKSWKNLELRTFNPLNSQVGDPISGFESADIRGLSVGPNGRLWISTGEGVKLLDANTLEPATTGAISVGLIPNTNVKFVDF